MGAVELQKQLARFARNLAATPGAENMNGRRALIDYAERLERDVVGRDDFEEESALSRAVVEAALTYVESDDEDRVAGTDVLWCACAALRAFRERWK
jgi:hypothetical protein